MTYLQASSDQTDVEIDLSVELEFPHQIRIFGVYPQRFAQPSLDVLGVRPTSLGAFQPRARFFERVLELLFS